MARMKPTALLLADVRRRWAEATSQSDRKKIIDEAREPFGYSYSHMTRLLDLNARSRSLPKHVSDRMDEKAELTRKVYDFKQQAGGANSLFKIAVAFDALKDDGQLPEWFTLSMLRQTARSLGIKNEYTVAARKFSSRHEALYLVELDYSKSQYFRFNTRGQIFMQKKESTKDDEPRLYFAAAVDWYSRVGWVQYFESEGESAAFVQNAFILACEPKEAIDLGTGEVTRRALLQGMPARLYTDRGKGNSAEITREGLERLRIKHIIGTTERDARGRSTSRSNSKARGLIEKFIGDFKAGFEARLWAKRQLGSMEPHITLERLNELALEYCERINRASHPLDRSLVKWDLFEPVLNTCSYPPQDARMYFGAMIRRKVQRRLVMGHSRHDWFIVPEIVSDGATVDVLLNGSECYLYHEHSLMKLKAQAGTVAAMQEEEIGAEIYGEQVLRERLAMELDLRSGGEVTMRTLVVELSGEFTDDLEEFLSKPRSTDEIKHKARYFIDAVGTTRHKAAKKTATVIPFMPPPERPHLRE